MKKKLISSLLAAVMVVTMLAACGGESTTETKNIETNVEVNESRAVEETAAGELTPLAEKAKIVVTLLVAPGMPLSGIPGVQDAINAITIPQINVEVELKTVELFQPMSQYPMWISAGEDLDLICTAFTGITQFATQGMLEPMDSLIADYAPTISGLLSQFDMANGAVLEDSIYGIAPVDPYYGTRYGVLFRNDWLAEAGITIDENKTYTMEELEGILASVKEKYPDKYLLAFSGKDINASLSLFSYMTEIDTLAASFSSGALMGTDSTTVENIFATEEYYNFVKRMSEWKQKGYTHPDAATTDTVATDFIKNEISGGYLMRTTPEQISGAETNLEGIDFVTINLTDYYYPTYKANVFWSIPITCDQPEAAIKFLDLMYTEIDIPSTLMLGIKDVDWVVVDDPLVAYPEGVTADTVTYANGLGMFGDRRYERTHDISVTREAYEHVTNESLKNPTQSNGFMYDNTNVINQIMNIDTVLAQYMAQLECGINPDELDSVYNTFLSELEAAGINDVIADKQAQLDAYLAQ